jgi:Transcriptional regulators of sugar metabolism
VSLNARQNEILNWVQQCDLLKVEEMVDRFGVSSQTIRKDVNQLAERNLVRRQHGGIAPVSTAENIPFSQRQHLNGLAKEQIAKRVANAIPNGSSIFLGIGTTVEYVAKALQKHQGLQVFTNNITVATILGQCDGIAVRMTAGKLRHQHHDLVGDETLESIRRYYFDYGVVGCGGLSETQGVLDFDPDEATVSRTIIDQSRHVFLVADQHKWCRKAVAVVTPFSRIERLFTDHLSDTSSACLVSNQVSVELCTSSL